MKVIQKFFTKEKNIKNGYKYNFDVQEDGLYLIEIIASAKSWWQNLLKIKFGDDDLTVQIDDIGFPKLNGKKGLFDGEVAWNGNNLKGFSKTDIFIINFSKGIHTLTFLTNQSPTLNSIEIKKVDYEINYIPKDNNPAENGDRRQWMTIVLANLSLKNINIKAIAKNYLNQNDADDIKLIINGEIELNENKIDKKHKYWYWSGKFLKGQEKEFNKEFNKTKGIYYIELWADRMLEIKNIKIDIESGSSDIENTKIIPTVDNPEWTGDFNDDTEQVILARAIFGEVRSLSEKGRIAVGWSIKNRIFDSRWGNNYHQVILKPKQYSAFNGGDKNLPYVKNPFLDKTQIGDWYECYKIADKVIKGEVNDPTNGDNHYFSDYIKPPSWAKSKNAEFKIKIGNTLFYNLKQSGNKGFTKIINTVLIFGMILVIIFFYEVIKNNDWCAIEKEFPGGVEIEQYQSFLINPKTNEIQLAHFSPSGKFLRMETITTDSQPKRQLNVFEDSWPMGYLQDIIDQEGSILIIKTGAYEKPREIYKSDKFVAQWKWLDTKHADVFFNCGTGCQYYKRINVDTKEIENDVLLLTEVSNR